MIEGIPREIKITLHLAPETQALLERLLCVQPPVAPPVQYDLGNSLLSLMKAFNEEVERRYFWATGKRY